jgi:hypothetical protein
MGGVIVVTLKEGKIIDQWSALLEQCQGHGEGVLQAVEGNLKAAEAPGVSWRRESVSPGWLKGLFGKRRDFLLVTHGRFDDYLMCVGARDYGTSLDVSWYLTGSTKSALVRAVAEVPGVGVAAGIYAGLKSLDVFDQQDLTAYVTVGHRSVRTAVEQLMVERKLDLARLERKSRGMFGVS